MHKTFLVLITSILCAASNYNAHAVEILVDDLSPNTLGLDADVGLSGFTVSRDVTNDFQSNGSGTGFDLVTLSSNKSGSIIYDSGTDTFGDILRSVDGGATATGIRIGFAYAGFDIGGDGSGDFTLDVLVDGASIGVFLMSTETTPFTVNDASIDGATNIEFAVTSTSVGGGLITFGTTPPSGGFFVTGVPEPTSLLLFGSVLGFAGIRRRK